MTSSNSPRVAIGRELLHTTLDWRIRQSLIQMLIDTDPFEIKLFGDNQFDFDGEGWNLIVDRDELPIINQWYKNNLI